MHDASPSDADRMSEWFVPRFGSPRFRALVGMLFLPYTGMCVSFAVTGSLLGSSVYWDRVAAIAVIFLLGLGLSAHAADAIGSRRIKPWANYFSRRELLILLLVPVAISYAIGIYYIEFYVPFLGLFALLEGFFLFAYNFELFNGAFHNNFWFAISWGALPLLTGAAIAGVADWRTPIIAAGLAAAISYYHIRISRGYKELKRRGNEKDLNSDARHLELRLKILSFGVIAFTLAFLALRSVWPQ